MIEIAGGFNNYIHFLAITMVMFLWWFKLCGIFIAVILLLPKTGTVREGAGDLSCRDEYIGGNLHHLEIPTPVVVCCLHAVHGEVNLVISAVLPY